MTDTAVRAVAKPTTATRQDAAVSKKARPVTVVAPPIGDPVGLLYNGSPAITLGGLVQPKVVIGVPDDPFEREADLVADHVTRGHFVAGVSRLPAAGLGGVSQRLPAAAEDAEPESAPNQEEELAQAVAVQRQASDDAMESADASESPAQELVAEEQPAQTVAVQRNAADEVEEPAQPRAIQRQSAAEEEEQPLQTQANGFGDPPMRTAAAQAIHSKGAGEPLQAPVRASLERGLGTDLGAVRVHASASAAALPVRSTRAPLPIATIFGWDRARRRPT